MANEEPREPQLVVVGSSAGGIGALSTFVETLPADFPAPIVIAQHLDPARQSYLSDILARRSTLPVRLVRDQLPLEPGVVYVAPANYHVEISDHLIRLLDSDERESQPSIDLLLSSAARVFGENLIAVILTGMGTDGSAGARVVKEQGGVVVIQNPQNAQFPGMPSAIAPTLVDVVVEIDDLSALLHSLLTGTYLPERPAEYRTLQSLLTLVHDASGIDFTRYKPTTVQRRVQRRMLATGMARLADYVDYVQAHPEEFDRLVSAFLIKVTEFFRDPELFDYLRDHILPRLIKEARERDNHIRLWSAGCATGEEAYSLGILLAQALGDDLEHFTIRIFATDLDSNAVAFARRGIYPASVLASVPADLIERFFVPHHDGYEVSKRIRNLVVFGHHDLGQRPPFPHIDLCLCRNVLIYFTPELQQRALQLFAFALRNDGFLVLGKSETPGAMARYFASAHPQFKIYRRVGERLQFPGTRLNDPAAFRLSQLAASQRVVARPGTPGARQPPRPATGIEQEATLLRNLPIGAISVDRHYDIETINPAARRMLRIHGPALGEDIVHLTEQLPALGLRAAIDSALNGVPQEFTISVEAVGGEPRYLRISCAPLPLVDPGGDQPEADPPADRVQITLVDITALETGRRATEDAVSRELAAIQEASAEAATQLTQLQAQYQRLVATTQELEAANSRLSSENAMLRVTNDEFLLGNEELQAAMEEVETLNEELQASNEELETLNEELQATIEELNTTYDDLEARSQETRELAMERELQRRISEEERGRLSAILLSMTDAVLVVDRTGAVVLANAAAERLFGPAGAPRRLEDEHGQLLPPDQTPQARAARGESFTMTFTLPISPGTSHWFEATGNPIDGALIEQGGVVVIRDITDRSLRRLQAEFTMLASHELRSPLTALRGYLQLVGRRLEQGDGDEQLRRYLSAARDQVDRLGRLQDDLLDVARLQEGKLTLRREPVDLVQVVRGLAEAVQAASAAAPPLELDLTSEPLLVLGDSTRLSQVMLNLLNNAQRHASTSPRIEVHLQRKGHSAELTVRDYGPGIPEDALPHIFDRFVRGSAESAQEGLGVGLFITREIVDAHGGEITVHSAEGQGATFTVRLPLIDSGAHATHERSAPPA